MKMTNKQVAEKVINQLHNSGFEALLAGGCVRDMLLNRKANDYDVATNATPKDVMGLFRRTVKIGAKFGVVIVLIEDKKIEVATFRTEEGYVDGRRPTSVKFSNAAEDAGRRDFTINGMFYDLQRGKVIDYVNGQADIKNKLIQTIGKPQERFGEDYLRMLRAVRFSTQLDFAIEPQTWKAACVGARNIAKISSERIAMELEAIFVNPNRSKGMSLLVESGLANVIFPGFTKKQAEFAIAILGQLPEKINFALGLTCVFADCKKQFALDKIKFLKLSRNQTAHIKFLLSKREFLLNDKMSLAELKTLLSKPYFQDLYELQKAIQKVKFGNRKSLVPLINLRKRIKKLGNVQLHPKPLLNGHNLIGLGAVSGPELGQLTKEIYIAQLEGQLETVKQAQKWAKEWLQKHKQLKK